MSASLNQLLEPFGAPSRSILTFSEDDCSDPGTRLDYLDLLRLRDGRDRPDGVVRIERTTVAYVLHATEHSVEPARIHRMRRLVAQRDDAPFLVVASPGRLAIYNVALDRLRTEQTLIQEIIAADPGAPTTFRRLHQEPATKDQARQQAVHELLYGLLTKAIDSLHGDQGLSRTDAIALAGRALFMRFLVDRGVVGQNRKGPVEICPGAADWASLFSTEQNTRATSLWLDRTFNGDFLPVSVFSQGHLPGALARGACEHLEAIMRRSPQAALSFDQKQSDLRTPFAWDELDFAHIPVGILSQVYERQAERWDPQRRRSDSVYYTPRRIAEYMTREAFARLEQQLERPPDDVRVLDPAVGGGVFLVAAFREIAAARYKRWGTWPTTRALRSILFNQLAGFDIQETALSLAALSLYLTAIELDQPPYLFKDLRFERPLRNTVLFDVRETTAQDGPVLGSLGPAVGSQHRGRYDLVLGNPPWTSLPGVAGSVVIEGATRQIRPIVSERLGEERGRAFSIPDNDPDLPFLWRAMEWARPNGILGFALDARLLFRTAATGKRAREDVLDAISVWGVLNGTDLRLTPVWPEISRPFCLLFAENARPASDHTFPMLSPYFEPTLNHGGRLRVDPEAFQNISPERLKASSELLKTLFRGTALDVYLLESLRRKKLPELAVWWRSLNLAHGQGFQTSSLKEEAGHLLGMPMLTAADRVGVRVDDAALARFAYPRLHRARDHRIYQGPLLLLRESAILNRDRVHVSEGGVVFSRTFYGYSAHGHPCGSQLVKYLCLLLTSSLFEWFSLMTGSKFGVEREVLHKIDVDAFPVVPFESLTDSQKEEIGELFLKLAESRLDRGVLTAWVVGVYRLGQYAAEVIEETLKVGLPHRENHQFACAAPDSATLEGFRQRLETELAPFVKVRVVLASVLPGDPYRVLVLDPRLSPSDLLSLDSGCDLLRAIDQQGLSELVLADKENPRRVWLARLAQNRYWTQSRARLVAARLLREQLPTMAGDA